MQPDVLVERLVVARAARLSFEAAWPSAVRRACRSNDREQRARDRAAVEATRAAWRRAYVGEPPARGERAAATLVGLLADAAGEGVEPTGVVGQRVA